MLEFKLIPNEYVLSVLKFTYPTVFQGWQTLVGVLILKCLTMKKQLDVTVLDKTTAINLLPHCLYFLGAIVAGSKALATLPIPVFVSVCNIPPACIFLLDCSASLLNPGLVQVTAGLVSLGAAVSVILLDVSLPFTDSGYSWLLAHILFLTAQILHSRITNPRYTEVDKLYYSNIFSVIILAPSSFYLEEAFSVLHFQHRRQIRFYLGCLLSGVLGVLLQLWSAKLRSNQRFQRSQALAKLLACLVAVPLFSPELSVPLWGFVAANLISSVLFSSDYESLEKRDEWLDV
ncbi:transmembrane protein 241-like isoform X3 [Zootermopsis nevadensis]|uniref:transmembrane protein 241-like isoform X3 n=1 Tax=Zootermopsis nevadensis TaxID=136037 RepID=UPI000B8EC022|nr:transmembrane protein 241-like isoform X3 [Zootermopsis nevadensis]